MYGRARAPFTKSWRIRWRRSRGLQQTRGLAKRAHALVFAGVCVNVSQARQPPSWRSQVPWAQHGVSSTRQREHRYPRPCVAVTTLFSSSRGRWASDNPALAACLPHTKEGWRHAVPTNGSPPKPIHHGLGARWKEGSSRQQLLLLLLFSPFPRRRVRERERAVRKPSLCTPKSIYEDGHEECLLEKKIIDNHPILPQTYKHCSPLPNPSLPLQWSRIVEGGGKKKEGDWEGGVKKRVWWSLAQISSDSKGFLSRRRNSSSCCSAVICTRRLADASRNQGTPHPNLPTRSRLHLQFLECSVVRVWSRKRRRGLNSVVNIAATTTTTTAITTNLVLRAGKRRGR